jgi:hypothetical protein
MKVRDRSIVRRLRKSSDTLGQARPRSRELVEFNERSVFWMKPIFR